MYLNNPILMADSTMINFKDLFVFLTNDKNLLNEHSYMIAEVYIRW